jgi:molybdopterin converting factor subunit 1
MRVRVRLFASLREAVGASEIELDLPEGATAETAWQRLADAHVALGPRRARLTAAVNRRYALFDTTLHDGDEVVFVPPVSGG